jgi:hypothetical protein
MRIIDKESKKTLNSVVILLTPEEAAELASKLKSLDASKGNHLHVNDIAYKREVTIAIYTIENLDSFSEDVRNMLAKQ